MSQPVVAGAQLTCSFGASPAALVVLPHARVQIEGRPVANVMDHVPLVNIPTFGLCRCAANPAVAAAPAAAMGAPTPAPCVPATATPWAPGVPTVLAGGLPVVSNLCVCACTWGGVVTVVSPGVVQTTVL
jgi:hypothetical protein